jgi:NAD(P)H-quinone oxidoreductase subunit 5
MTRVSIKVHLAWSTCAQMGFMLVQCGLGAYQLALLHLLAHSLYKAHAFLSSGSVVDTYRALSIVPARKSPSFGRHALAAAVALLGVGGASVALGVDLTVEPALLAFLLVLSIALTPLLARTTNSGRMVLASVAVAGLYFGWHALFSGWVQSSVQGELMTLRLGLVMGAFSLLFGLQVALQTWPQGALARALYPQLFAGFYLDEVFTRMTFRIWPPKRLPRSTEAHSAHVVGIQEG